MPPIVSVVGNSKSGKTTLIEKLLGELKSRGYKVATIKRAQEVTIGDVGKDSRRHLQAGSGATAVVSPGELFLVKPVPADITLDEIASIFGEDYDIIVTEGFKQDKAPKIEVHRKETGPLLTNIKNLIAIVTDESLETSVRQYDLNDVKGIADLLEEGFVLPQEESCSLYINDTPITLSTFPREFITSVMVAMASSLKGVGEISTLKLFLRKKG